MCVRACACVCCRLEAVSEAYNKNFGSKKTGKLASATAAAAAAAAASTTAAASVANADSSADTGTGTLGKSNGVSAFGSSEEL